MSAPVACTPSASGPAQKQTFPPSPVARRARRCHGHARTHGHARASARHIASSNSSSEVRAHRSPTFHSAHRWESARCRTLTCAAALAPVSPHARNGAGNAEQTSGERHRRPPHVAATQARLAHAHAHAHAQAHAHAHAHAHDQNGPTTHASTRRHEEGTHDDGICKASALVQG